MIASLKLPYATPRFPGIGGRIREICEDFIVEEIPVYEPEGAGEHLFVNLTRRGMSTRDVARGLATLFELPREAVGYAGLKDKHSVSTQTLSIHLGRIDSERIGDLAAIIESLLPVKVNWARQHTKKLRVGHLVGNRFTITVTGIEIDNDEARERSTVIADRLREMGLPNFYGPQRVDADNVRRGYEIINEGRLMSDRWLRRFLVTCYLDHLCNLYLVRRVEEGAFFKLMRGDIAKKASTGGMFLVKDLEAEQERYQSHEIDFTAPIYGPKMWWAEGPSGRLEGEILEGTGIELEDLRRLKVRGSRRLGRLTPDIEIREDRRGIRLSFTLPKGAYATIVLREIMKNEGR